MTTRQAIVWILAFCLLGFIGAGGVELLRDTAKTPPIEPGQRVKATITRVIDGDTVRATLADGFGDQTVRYIGVDTPESVKPGETPQCFGKAASAANRRLVEGRSVTLRVGAEPRDRYGRLLGYVYLQPGDRMVNELLIRLGLARTLAITPNTAFASRFERLQRRAQRLDRGLWGSCG